MSRLQQELMKEQKVRCGLNREREGEADEGERAGRKLLTMQQVD